MGYQPSQIEIEYTELKEKYKDKFRLVYEKYSHIVEGKLYYIEKREPRTNFWFWCHPIDEQPQKGFMSIFNLGDYEYTEEQWAKKCFIDYVREQCKDKQKVKIL